MPESFLIAKMTYRNFVTSTQGTCRKEWKPEADRQESANTELIITLVKETLQPTLSNAAPPDLPDRSIHFARRQTQPRRCSRGESDRSLGS